MKQTSTLVLWDGHLARPLYFRAGRMPTPQESSLAIASLKSLRVPASPRQPK